MVEIADIEDAESLEAWLTDPGQSREACVWIAHRAAMRALPGWWAWVLTDTRARKDHLTAISVLRANLLTKVATSRLTSEICVVAGSAVSAAFSAYANSRSTASAAAYSTANAAESVTTKSHITDCVVRAASAAAYSIERAFVFPAATRAETAAWSSLRGDCEIVMQVPEAIPDQWPPLWSDPELASELGAQLTTVLDTATSDWAFWRDW